MMVVPNTMEDVRFQGSQFVAGPPYIRFYAGAPLVGPLPTNLNLLSVVWALFALPPTPVLPAPAPPLPHLQLVSA